MHALFPGMDASSVREVAASAGNWFLGGALVGQIGHWVMNSLLYNKPDGDVGRTAGVPDFKEKVLQLQGNLATKGIHLDATKLKALLDHAGPLQASQVNRLLKGVSLRGGWAEQIARAVNVLNPSPQPSANTTSAPAFNIAELPPGLLIPDSKSFDVQGPVPIRVDISLQALHAGLSQRTLRRILGAISRQDLKDVTEEGRSLFFALGPRDEFTYRGQPLRSIKMKFVTYRGQPPKNVAYDDAEHEILQQPKAVLRLTSKGKIHFVPNRKHPVGGGYLDEALREYRTMLQSFEQGVPTGYPIGVGEFLDISFQDQRLCFILMALPSEKDLRSGFEFYRVMAPADRVKVPAHVIDNAFRTLVQEIGNAAMTLRSLHDLGTIHSHPHLGNFGLSLAGRAPLYDFTNARTQEEMTRDEFILRMLNDFRHFYFGVFALFSQHQGFPFYQMLVQVSGLPKSPLQTLVSNYFTAEDRRLVGDSRLAAASTDAGLVNYFQSTWTDPTQLEGKGLSDFPTEIVRIFEQIGGRIYDRLHGVSEAPANDPAAPRDPHRHTSLGIGSRQNRFNQAVPGTMRSGYRHNPMGRREVRRMSDAQDESRKRLSQSAAVDPYVKELLGKILIFLDVNQRIEFLDQEMPGLTPSQKAALVEGLSWVHGWPEIQELVEAVFIPQTPVAHQLREKMTRVISEMEEGQGYLALTGLLTHLSTDQMISFSDWVVKEDGDGYIVSIVQEQGILGLVRAHKKNTTRSPEHMHKALAGVYSEFYEILRKSSEPFEKALVDFLLTLLTIENTIIATLAIRAAQQNSENRQDLKKVEDALRAQAHPVVFDNYLNDVAEMKTALETADSLGEYLYVVNRWIHLEETMLAYVNLVTEIDPTPYQKRVEDLKRESNRIKGDMQKKWGLLPEWGISRTVLWLPWILPAAAAAWAMHALFPGMDASSAREVAASAGSWFMGGALLGQWGHWVMNSLLHNNPDGSSDSSGSSLLPNFGAIPTDKSNEKVFEEFLEAMKQAGYESIDEVVTAVLAEGAEGQGDNAKGYRIPRMPAYLLRVPHLARRVQPSLRLRPWSIPLIKNVGVGQPIAYVSGYATSSGEFATIMIFQAGFMSGAGSLEQDAATRKLYEDHLRRAAHMPQFAYNRLARDIMDINRQRGVFDYGAPGNLRVNSAQQRFAIIDIPRTKREFVEPNTLSDMAHILFDLPYAILTYGDASDEILVLRQKILSKILHAQRRTGLPLPEYNVAMYDAYENAGLALRQWIQTRRELLSNHPIDSQEITVYHALSLELIPSILKYGYYANIERPTLSLKPKAYWKQDPTLVFKTRAAFVKDECLTTETREDELPRALRQELRNILQLPDILPNRSIRAAAKSLLDSEKEGVLGALAPEELDVPATLEFNRQLLQRHELSPEKYEALRQLLSPQTVAPRRDPNLPLMLWLPWILPAAAALGLLRRYLYEPAGSPEIDTSSAFLGAAA